MVLIQILKIGLLAYIVMWSLGILVTHIGTFRYDLYRRRFRKLQKFHADMQKNKSGRLIQSGNARSRMVYDPRDPDVFCSFIPEPSGRRRRLPPIATPPPLPPHPPENPPSCYNCPHGFVARIRRTDGRDCRHRWCASLPYRGSSAFASVAAS